MANKKRTSARTPAGSSRRPANSGASAADPDDRFRTLAEQSPNMIFVYQAGRVVYANPKSEELMGYSRDEFYAPEFDFRCLIAPEFQGAIEAAYRKHAGEEETAPLEYALITKAGRRIEAILTMKLMDDADGKAILGIVTDVTEHRRRERALEQSEQKYRALAETTSDIPFSMTAHGVIAYVGPQVARYGCRQEEVVGADFRDFVLPRDRDRLTAEFQRFVSTGQDPQIEFRVPCAEGRVPWFEERGTLHRDEKGQPLAITGVLRDVTDRKELEQALAELAAQERRRFGHDLHDGLGQELTGLGYMAWSLQHKLPPQDSGAADIAQTLVEGLRHAIESTRRIARGLVPVEIDELGLPVALEQLAAGTADRCGIPCDFRCRASVVVRDHVVATELFHIAQEAVNNAARHARASHLEMALVQTPDALSLTVRDDGVGLPAERSSNGGMGLRIMRYRAELIGGTLDIRSPQGGGTTIICTVPASELP